MLSARSLGSFVGTEDEQDIIDAISNFSCKDKDVESFLKSRAIDFERRNKSRSYLILDNDKLVNGEFIVLAYFTLSLKSLEFRDTLSKSKIKEIDGFSKEVKGVAIALVGQLGKDENFARNMSGKEILNICMDFIFQVQTLIGGRHVLIECQDHDKIVDFYRNNSFEFLQTDKSDNYLQMVRRI
jgi:hypothetical protein